MSISESPAQLTSQPSSASGARRFSFQSSILIGLLLATVGALLYWVVLARRSPREVVDAALVSLNAGRWEEFDAAIESLKKDPAQRDSVDFLQGVRLLTSGRIHAALQRFSLLSPEGDLREPVLLYTGVGLKELGRLPEAVSVLTTLIKENPAHVEGHRWLGIIYYDLGAYDFAIKQMRELASLVPDDFRPYRLMGMMYRDFEQETEAIEAYTAALSRNPPDDVRIDVSIQLATAFLSQKRFEDALSTLQGLPDSGAAALLRARCFWGTGRQTEAKAALQLAKKLSANEREAGLLEAEFLMASRDAAGAVEILRTTVARFPYDAETHYQLALALRDTGNAAEAEQLLLKWKQLKELAQQLSQKNFEALGNPGDPLIRDELARLCDALGKTELATMWRNAAASLRTVELAPGVSKK